MYTLRIALSCVFLLGFASFVLAQQSKTSPTPRPEDSDVVKITTNLVQIDVSITDRKGNPVTDLRRDEIEIYENGKRQDITSFSFVSGVRERTQASPRVQDGIAVPVAPGIPRSENIRRTIALVVDDLSLSFESAYRTRQALRKFVNEKMEEGDLVAILRVGGGVGALQQFTTDKRILLAAVERVKWNPRSRGGAGAFAPIQPTPSELLRSSGDTNVSDEDIQQEKELLEGNDQFRNNNSTTDTLAALRYIVSGMTPLPGRKSVVLFSDGIPQLQSDLNGFTGAGRVMSFLQTLIDTANRAAVVFYTIDSRGLLYTGPTAADKISTDPRAYSQVISRRSNEVLNTQGGLAELARLTGGIAYLNQNDIGYGLDRVLKDQSYYLIGYEPDSDTFDPAKLRYNRFEIKVSRQDIVVRHRSGYFNVDDDNFARRAAVPRVSAERQLNEALMSPFAQNDISLSLSPLWGNDARQGDFVRSLLHINAGDLTFKAEPNGTLKAEIAIIAGSFGDNGLIADFASRGYTFELTPAQLDRFKRDGIVYFFTFPVKKPGAFQYRVAIRDQNSGRVGSASEFVQIPTVKSGRPQLSGIVLRSFTASEWERIAIPGNAPASDTQMLDTARRRFTAGSVLQYGLEVYGLRTATGGSTQVTQQVRIFRDGKLISVGNIDPIVTVGAVDPARVVGAGGAIHLPVNLEPGDYILQIVVKDALAKEKNQIATQFVQFELVN